LWFRLFFLLAKKHRRWMPAPSASAATGGAILSGGCGSKGGANGTSKGRRCLLAHGRQGGGGYDITFASLKKDVQSHFISDIYQGKQKSIQ
jgi:hypothetical protein